MLKQSKQKNVLVGKSKKKQDQNMNQVVNTIGLLANAVNGIEERTTRMEVKPQADDTSTKPCFHSHDTTTGTCTR